MMNKEDVLRGGGRTHPSSPLTLLKMARQKGLLMELGMCFAVQHKASRKTVCHLLCMGEGVPP